MVENVTISKKEYDSMKETIEILSDPALVKSIKKGMDDIAKGRTISLSEYLKKK